MYRGVAILICFLVAHSIASLLSVRIIGGSKTTITAYPFVVSVRKHGKHICGGSIIKNNVIVTAAHCVIDSRPAQLSIRAGSTYRTRGGTLVLVNGWKRHPKFNAANVAYDIALIYLKRHLVYSSSIRPIPLNGIKLYDKDMGVAIGWGVVSENGRPSQVLKKTSLPLQSIKTCRRVYPMSGKSQFCAGRMAGGTDTCQGDSGGPIVVNGVLAGITSTGIGCARKGSPGLYTRVNFLQKWINKNA